MSFYELRVQSPVWKMDRLRSASRTSAACRNAEKLPVSNAGCTAPGLASGLAMCTSSPLSKISEKIDNELKEDLKKQKQIVSLLLLGASPLLPLSYLPAALSFSTLLLLSTHSFASSFRRRRIWKEYYLQANAHPQHRDFRRRGTRRVQNCASRKRYLHT